MSNGPFLESIVLGGEKLTIRDPNASHDISVTDIVNMLYPVGSVIIRYDTLSPGDYLNVGEWSLVQAGKYLLTTSGEAGGTGGNNEVTLSVDNLPEHSHSLSDNGNHKHTATVSNSGSHTHDATIGSGGDHTHSATSDSAGEHMHGLKGYSDLGASGKSGIKLGAGGPDTSKGICNTDGEHSHGITVNSGGAHTHTAELESSGQHTHVVTLSETGEHTHTVGNTGNGTAISIEPEYIAVRVWRRTA